MNDSNEGCNQCLLFRGLIFSGVGAHLLHDAIKGQVNQGELFVSKSMLMPLGRRRGLAVLGSSFLTIGLGHLIYLIHPPVVEPFPKLKSYFQSS